MIIGVTYTSTPTVKALFIDVVNYANIDAIKSNRQKWYINSTCINNSVIALKNLFEHSGIQITSPNFADEVFEVFKSAGLDSMFVTLNDEDNVFFSFRDGKLKIVAKDENIEYIFSDFDSFLNTPEFSELNMWHSLIETLKDFF